MNTKVVNGMSAFLIVVMVALAVVSAVLTLQADSNAGGSNSPPVDRGQAVSKWVMPDDMKNGYGDHIPDAFVPFLMTDLSGRPYAIAASGDPEQVWTPGQS